jgi:hypothetical protein
VAANVIARYHAEQGLSNRPPAPAEPFAPHGRRADTNVSGRRRDDGDPCERAQSAAASFRPAKLGHVVLNLSDLARSVKFYTEALGFAVSDVYPENDWKWAHSLEEAIADPVRGQDTTVQDRSLLPRR